MGCRGHSSRRSENSVVFCLVVAARLLASFLSSSWVMALIFVFPVPSRPRGKGWGMGHALPEEESVSLLGFVKTFARPGSVGPCACPVRLERGVGFWRPLDVVRASQFSAFLLALDFILNSRASALSRRCRRNITSATAHIMTTTSTIIVSASSQDLY